MGRVAHAAPRAMAPRRAPEWRRSLRDWGAAVGRWGSCYAPAGSCDYGAIAQTGGRRGSVAGGGVDIQRHAPHRPHSWLLEPARARRQVPTFPMDLQGPLQTSGRTPRGHTWHLGARARPRSGPGYWMCWHGSTTFVPRGPGAGSSRRGGLRRPTMARDPHSLRIPGTFLPPLDPQILAAFRYALHYHIR